MTLEMKLHEEREEGIREGLREGLQKGTLLTLKSLIDDGTITPEYAAARAGMSVEDYLAEVDRIKSNIDQK